MSPMSQQINPAALTAILSDPRAQPAQRMAAMSMLKQLQGGFGSPMPTPQGDGTGAGDMMNPAFIQAVQSEMKREQSPQGLPQQLQTISPDSNPTFSGDDEGVQSDIRAGVDAAAGMAGGGAVRGYAGGGRLADLDRIAKIKRLSEATGITDSKWLRNKLDELESNSEPGFLERAVSGYNRLRSAASFGRAPTGNAPYLPDINIDKAPSVDSQIASLEAEAANKQKESYADQKTAAPFLWAKEGAKLVGVTNPSELDFAAPPAAVAEQAAATQSPIPKPTVQQRAAVAMQPSPAPAPAAAAAPVVAAMPGPAAPVDDGGYAERMKKLLDDDEGDMTPREKSMALIQAGAAMMAGASKPGATFLGSAGEGLTKGLEGFNTARSERAVKRMKQAALLQAERQAGIENAQRDKGIVLQERQVGQGDEKIKLEKSQQKLEELKNNAMTQYYLAEANRAGRPVEPSVFKEKRDALVEAGVPIADATRQAAGLEAKEQPESVLYSKALDAAIKLIGNDMNLISLTPEQKMERAQQMAAKKVSDQMSGTSSIANGVDQSNKISGSDGGWGIVKD